MNQRIPYGIQKDFSIFKDTMVEMTWQEVQAGADCRSIVLLPLGIVESHGPHMDLSADFYLSTLLCLFLKQELYEKGIEALIAPPVYWGISKETAGFAGTFSIRPEIMKGLLTDILLSLKNWGFRRVFIQNAHGDSEHIQIIREAMAAANQSLDFKVYFMWELNIEVNNNVVFPPFREDRFNPDYHAGSIETAQMVTFFPDKVRVDVAKTLLPQDSFKPFAYCGDPASYDLEINIGETAYADTKLDSIKIEAILERDGR